MSFKAVYRRQWLEYMVDCFTININPLTTMDLQLALRWSTCAWSHNVTNLTIYNCFCKSTVINQPAILPVSSNAELADLYRQVQEQGEIAEVLPLASFPEPEDEEIVDNLQGIDSDDLFTVVLNNYLDHSTIAPQDDEDEAELSERQVPTVHNALGAAHILIEFLESQEGFETQLR